MPVQKRKRAPTTTPAPDPTHAQAFAPDTPVSDPQFDRFKRHPFAQRVAKTLALRTDPSSIVVLVHGAWGEGKTTVLEFIDRELRAYDDIVTVKFNPWRVTDESSLLLAFFATIAASLDQSAKTLKERLGDAMRRYGDIASEFHLDLHGVKLSTGKVVSKVGEALSMLTLEERRTRIEELLEKAGTRVVVFLDDIDRLDRTETQAVFKLLKLTANIANISYILAFDRDVVAHAIGAQYGTGSPQAGYEYLEKIVQVNLSLPVADPDALTSLCIGLLNEAITHAGLSLTPEQQKEFELAFLQDIAPDLTTPRMAKLYANAVSFALPLLADELNPVDLLILEALKCFHPAIHEHIRKNPGMYTGTFGWDLDTAINRGPQCKSELEETLERNSATRNRAKHLLTALFPQLYDLFRSGKYGNSSDANAARDQRVRDHDYLKRYLASSIPTGDLSDKEVHEFLRKIPTLGPTAIGDEYRSLLRPGQELVLLLKFKTQIREVSVPTGRAVCSVIAQNGDLLPDSADDWARLPNTAGLVIHDFAKRLEARERKQFAMDTLREAQPLQLAAICFGWMELRRNQHESERLFPVADEADLRDILADRVAQQAQVTPLLAGRPSEFLPLLHAWHASKGETTVQAHLAECLRNRPDDALLLLAPFANPVVLTPDGYAALTKFVKPADLLEAMRTAGLLDAKRTDPEARLAQSFESIHSAATAPAASSNLHTS
jgi:hypothetical protein